MRSLRTAIFLLAVLLSWPEEDVSGAARELFPNTPDEVILQKGGQQAKPLWQIPLGPALIEDMQSIGPERLLVGLRKDFPALPNLDYLLVDTGKGEVLWRFPREKIKGEFDKLLVLKDILLFRVSDKKTTTLLALDTGTGKQKWTNSWKGDQVTFTLLLSTASVLAVEPSSDSVQMAALDLETGGVVWKKTDAVANAMALPQPLPSGQDVLLFYSGLERISGKDGQTLFSQPDMKFDSSCPPPLVDEGILWVVDSGNQLSALDEGSGRVRWLAPLQKDNVYTQVYPMGQQLFLRGVSVSGSHFIARVDPANGRTLWTYSSPEPSISNLIESGGILYFGTPGSIIALGVENGKSRFSVQVTKTGRSFPVRIRKIGDRIVYIGELVVAAFDAGTGRLIYRQGMTPGSEELHLNGLDAAAPNLKSALQEASNELEGKGPGGKAASRMISLATRETTKYQNLARYYSSRSYSQRSSGDVLGSNISSMKATFAQREAAFQSTMALALSITNIAMMYRQFLYARSIETFIERQSLFRKSILSSYGQSETEEYVYRPHLVYRNPMDVFSVLSVVNLQTGKRSETVLSPHYLSYGLWQVADFEKGVVYHCNIGMDPSKWELSEARMYYPYDKARTVNTFLIAQPFKIPR